MGTLRYKTAFDSVQNLVVNETMLRAAEELEVKYETEKKEMQITTLEEEKRLMIWFSIAESLPTVQFVWYGDESRLDPKLEEVVYRTAHELINYARNRNQY
jgi:hypothetical protein